MPDESNTSAELAELRRRLDAIDDGIIDLAAERQAIVTAISEHKLDTAAPLRHYEREAEIIERGTARTEKLGLSPRLARDILETLIHHLLENQETHKLVSSNHSSGKRALVIGGMGR
jgi:chorismate mutase